MRWIACLCASLLFVVACGDVEPDDRKTSGCGTTANPTSISVEDIEPTGAVSVANWDIQHRFTVVNPPGAFSGLNFAFGNSHSAGARIPTSINYQSTLIGNELSYVSAPFRWEDAPGSVDVRHTGVFVDAAGCVFAMPGLVFSYELIPASNGCVDSWRRTVLQSQVGWQASLGLTPDGAAHIAFQNLSDNELRYANRPAAAPRNWTIGMIADDMSFNDLGMVIDSTGGVHVTSEGNVTNEGLRYSYSASGGGWTTTTIEDETDMRYVSDLVVDANDGLHVAFKVTDLVYGTVKYAYKPSGGGWAIEVIDDTGCAAGTPAVDIDSTQTPHVSFHCCTGTSHDVCEPKHAERVAANNWSSETIESGTGLGAYGDLLVDDLDGLHVSYYDFTNRGLRYATKASGGTWSSERVDPAQGVMAAATSLALDSLDRVHIVYASVTGSDEKLKHAEQNGAGGWEIETVDSIGTAGVGHSISLAIDAQDNLFIAYDDTTRGLLFAETCQSP